MEEYPKINTIWMRDEKGKILEGQYSCPEFDYLKDNAWRFTEKVDGTNIRVKWNNPRATFGGKTDDAQISSILVEQLMDTFSPDRMALVGQDSFCLYGEGYGARIHKGGGNYNKDGVGFVLFDVKVGSWWLEHHNVVDVANKLDIEMVPTLGEGTLAKMCQLVQQGFESTWGHFPAEGIVAKPIVDLWNRKGERIITKIKARDYRK